MNFRDKYCNKKFENIICVKIRMNENDCCMFD